MFRHIQDPKESRWTIEYFAFDEETGKYVGFLDFSFYFDLGAIIEPNVALVSIVRNMPDEHPQFGQIWRGTSAAIAPFAYEKEGWYKLKIERDGSEYIFWIGDLGLFLQDEFLPIGSIGIRFHGKCNIRLDVFTVTGPIVPDEGPGILQVNPLAD